MKKTKRASRSRSVRRQKPTESAGRLGVVWMLVVLVIAGAIGWYAYKQSGGLAGAKAGTEASRQIARVAVNTANSEPLKTGQTASFVAQAYGAKGEAIDNVAYVWTIDKVTADSANGSIQAASDSRYAQLSKIELPNNRVDGYLAVRVQATVVGAGQPPVVGGKVVSVATSKTLARVALSPLVTSMPLHSTRIISATSADQDGKSLAGAAQYRWLIINATASGDFGSDDMRVANGAQANVRASKLGNPQVGGYFNVLLSATYNGVTKYTGTVVWVSPEPALSLVTISPKIGTTGFNRAFTLQAVTRDAQGAVLKTGVTYTWQTGGLPSRYKFDVLDSWVESDGTGMAKVAFTKVDPTAPAWVSQVRVNATYKGVTKSDVAVITLHD